MYNIETHGDFQRWYDKKLKRHYWILGYFGGGAINLVEAMEIGKQYATENDVSLDTVVIDEILKSRRYKGFKVIYSTRKCSFIHPKVEPLYIRDNVWADLTD